MTLQVFLCHNADDKPMVRQIAERVRARGVNVWLDEERLLPGRRWQQGLSHALRTVDAAIVAFGPNGLGAWQDMEINVVLDEYVERGIPVIPVLLPDAEITPDVPVFLKQFTWVDLRHGISESGIDRIMQGIGAETVPAPPTTSINEPPPRRASHDKSVDISVFCGRHREIAALRTMLIDDGHRVVIVAGFGGMGKSALTERILTEVDEQFSLVFRRALNDAPHVADVLAECVRFIWNRPDAPVPSDVDSLIDILLTEIAGRRVLIILDNAETILRTGTRAGQYREDHRGYGTLIQRMATANHSGCLLLTSREIPDGVDLLRAEGHPVAILRLHGLTPAEGVDLLRRYGLSAPVDSLERLVALYSGNPLALRIASSFIAEAPFGGDLQAFLAQNVAVVAGIDQLMSQHLSRLTSIEKDVVFWLAVEREPITFDSLRANLVFQHSASKIIEAVNSLSRRSLIEASGVRYTLQPAVMEFVTDLIVDLVVQDLREETVSVIDSFALVKAGAKDHVRKSQTRLLLEPIVREMRLDGVSACRRAIRAALQTIRSEGKVGYAAGSILQMLMLLREDLTQYDFRGLTIRCVDLSRTPLMDVDFSGVHFYQCTFIDSFGSVTCVRFRPDGDVVAMACGDGTVRLWDIAGTPIRVMRAHADWVRSIAFHPHDHSIIATASDDKRVRLLDTETGEVRQSLEGHDDRVFAVVFAPAGDRLFSAGADGTVRMWSGPGYTRGEVVARHRAPVVTLAMSEDGSRVIYGDEHGEVFAWTLATGEETPVDLELGSAVRAVAASSNVDRIAIGCDDGLVRLYGAVGERETRKLAGHKGAVLGLSLRPGRDELASAGEDGTVRIWDPESGMMRLAMEGHTNWVNSVAYSPSGSMLASGGADQTIRLWDAETGSSLRTLSGHSSPVWSVATDPDGRLIASGHGDNLIRIWDLETGRQQLTLIGHNNWVWAVVFVGSDMVASGSGDGRALLWSIESHSISRELRGHSGAVRGLAVSTDRRILASAGQDGSVRLWDIASGSSISTLRAHTQLVESVCFSPTGDLLASGGADRTVIVWDGASGRMLHRFGTDGTLGRIRAVRFSRDGGTLAACSDDGVIWLWDVQSGEAREPLRGHVGRVTGIEFDPTGTFALSCGVDGTVRRWTIGSPSASTVLYRHTSHVRAMTLTLSGDVVVSGGLDETIRVHWLSGSRADLHLRSDPPYARMNIAGVTGLNETQLAVLKRLGATSSASRGPAAGAH